MWCKLGWPTVLLEMGAAIVGAADKSDLRSQHSIRNDLPSAGVRCLPACRLSGASFEYIRRLVQRRAAIVLEPNKAYLVQARLTPVAKTSWTREC